VDRVAKQVNIKPLLGVAGGMGTQVTSCFYDKLHALQSVTVEQEYLDVLIYSKPTIPDRTAYITGQSSESPLEPLICVLRALESVGSTLIAVPCVTSHFFYDDLVKAVNVPVLNMLEETAAYTAERGIGKVCLFATDGTLKGGAFHNAFKKHGIDVIDPSDEIQSALMAIIYDIKRGVTLSSCVLDPLIEKALKTGAEAAVLGCTELCLLGSKRNDTIDTLEILAKSAVRFG